MLPLLISSFKINKGLFACFILSFLKAYIVVFSVGLSWSVCSNHLLLNRAVSTVLEVPSRQFYVPASRLQSVIPPEGTLTQLAAFLQLTSTLRTLSLLVIRTPLQLEYKHHSPGLVNTLLLIVSFETADWSILVAFLTRSTQLLTSGLCHFSNRHVLHTH